MQVTRPEDLWVPLHPDNSMVEELGRFHQSVVRNGDSGESRSKLVDSLVVFTVDGDGSLASHPLGQQRARSNVDVVEGGGKRLIGFPVRDDARSIPGQIGMQGPTQCDVDELEAATDGEDRQAPLESGVEGTLLRRIASWVDAAQDRIVTIASIQDRVDVATATDDDSVEAPDHGLDVRLLVGAVDGHRRCTGNHKRVEEVSPQGEPHEIAVGVGDPDDGTIEVFVHEHAP